jgi:hypothetical protein
MLLDELSLIAKSQLSLNIIEQFDFHVQMTSAARCLLKAAQHSRRKGHKDLVDGRVV